MIFSRDALLAKNIPSSPLEALSVRFLDLTTAWLRRNLLVVLQVHDRAAGRHRGLVAGQVGDLPTTELTETVVDPADLTTVTLQGLVDPGTPRLQRANTIFDRGDRNLLVARRLVAITVDLDVVSVDPRRRAGRIVGLGLLREQLVELLDDGLVVLLDLVADLAGDAIAHATQGGVELVQARVERAQVERDRGRLRGLDDRLVVAGNTTVGGVVDAATDRCRLGGTLLAAGHRPGDEPGDEHHGQRDEGELGPARPAATIDDLGLDGGLLASDLLRTRGRRVHGTSKAHLRRLTPVCFARSLDHTKRTSVTVTGSHINYYIDALIRNSKTSLCERGCKKLT